MMSNAGEIRLKSTNFQTSIEILVRQGFKPIIHRIFAKEGAFSSSLTEKSPLVLSWNETHRVNFALIRFQMNHTHVAIIRSQITIETRCPFPIMIARVSISNRHFYQNSTRNCFETVGNEIRRWTWKKVFPSSLRNFASDIVEKASLKFPVHHPTWGLLLLAFHQNKRTLNLNSKKSHNILRWAQNNHDVECRRDQIEKH